MNTIEKKSTPLGKSYWDNTGVYQKEMDELTAQLMPSSGEAPTVHGEMIRAVNRLFYDFCNNGNCNVIETNEEDCPDCGGSGWEQDTCQECDGDGTVCWNDEEEECGECCGNGEVDIDCGYCGGHCKIPCDATIGEYYQDMIGVLEDNLPREAVGVVDEMVKFIKEGPGYSRYTFDDKEMGIYNKVVDEVMYYVLTTENKDR